ncbi:MAG: acyl carrier protein [Bacilli bacterium]|nr:acyl carrier protein [Bacilli bacterium]
MIEEVKQIISEEFFIEMEEITEESDLRNDLGIDSLAATQLILDLEKKYNIRISEEEAVELKKFSDVINILNKKVKKDEQRN